MISAKLRLFISPFLISKYYILRDVSRCVAKYHFGGKILDFGCGQKPYRDLFTSSTEYVGIDFDNYSINKDFTRGKPDYFFPKEYTRDFLLSFPDKTFDNTVAFQVMEHHPEPEIMLKEMTRVTKNGGLIMITIPFLGGLHEEPHDYQRYTVYKLQRICGKTNLDVLDIIPQGSLFSTVALLIMEHLNSFASKSSLHYGFSIFIYPIFLIMSYFALMMDNIVKTDKIVFNYLIVAKKL